MQLNSKKSFTIIGIIVIFVLTIVTGGYYYYAPLRTNAQETFIEIEKNATGDDIANILYEHKIINNTFAFKLALLLNDANDKLQAGYFKIPTDVNLPELIKILQKGGKQTQTLTIPEGFTIQEIAARLENQNIVSAADFLTEAKQLVPYMYMYGPTLDEYRVEGFLFPATYDIEKGANSKDIIVRMTTEMNEKLTPEIRRRIKDMNMSIYEFITLASIVEREALFDVDRPLIAAVFLHRLRLGMPLQSCATIEYVIGERKPFLTETDTQIDSPYNTYVHKGLPPGPISNPGMKSIMAVLDAQPTDYLFFVADKDGHHRFSKTYEEHLQKIESIYGKQ